MNRFRHPGSGKFKSHNDVRDFYVVCRYRKQLSIPIVWSEACAFKAGLEDQDNIRIVPWVEVRSWCGV